MRDDLTIMYISASRVPSHWRKFQITHLLEAADGAPIISVTHQPLNLGFNLVYSGPVAYWSIYQQMLMAAQTATTPFVAMAEDDVLYSHSHYHEFRPPMDTVAYNTCRWSLCTDDDFYNYKCRRSNESLIAPREYLIDALQERSAKWPAPNSLVGEVGRADSKLGVSRRNSMEFQSKVPNVKLDHPNGVDSCDYPNGLSKKRGRIRAYDIPHWGRASDILKEYR